MQQWLPVSTSPKGRLALAALRAFGTRAFDEVAVTDLADAAGVTTGAIYHHFGSKLGLYSFVRADVERRLLDRMQGALAVSQRDDDSVERALLVGFDFAVSEGFVSILGAPPPAGEQDRLVDLLGVALDSSILGKVVAAAWRAAVTVASDSSARDDARAALQVWTLRSR